MELITMIGLVAAALSTISLLPQLIRVWKTKSGKDISTVMCGIMCTSVVLWLTYGVLGANMPLVSSNSVVFLQTIAIMTLKTKYGYQPNNGRLSTIASKIRLRAGKDHSWEQEGEGRNELPFLL
ncbi:MAG: SemiSWEET family sugar transporter [Candidatus Bathyarchaeia archaeon]|jgi:MtN3 and saliva related transmembrane protein